MYGPKEAHALLKYRIINTNSILDKNKQTNKKRNKKNTKTKL